MPHLNSENQVAQAEDQLNGNPISYAKISLNRPILVVTPHPDDETLGCGALLADAFCSHGAHIIAATNGCGSHPGSLAWMPKDLGAQRQSELINAVEALGGRKSDVSFAQLIDGQLYKSKFELDKLVLRIIELIDRSGIKCIFLPSPLDAHADHKAIAGLSDQICILAPTVRCFFYPIWSRWDNELSYDKLDGAKCWSYRTVERREQKRIAIYCHLTQLGRVVLDDPDGFVLDSAMIEKFVHSDEVYLERLSR